MEFVVAARPNDRQQARLAGLGAAPVTAGPIWFWADDPCGIAQSDHLTLCGLARLNNRAALIARLDGSCAEEASDLEVILAYCAQAGAEGLTALEGAFALALWDEAAVCLSVIRDHFGVMPVYVAEGNAPIFASDLRLLAHVQAEALQPNMKEVAAFISGFEEDDARPTAFEGLTRLPKAHVATWRADAGMTDRQYWSLTLPEQIPLADAPGRLRDSLAAAVSQNVSDGVGCMLSGGLDSSTIAVLAAEGRSEPLRTLSFVYRDTDDYNEKPFIDAVNAQIAAEPVFLPIDGPPPPERLAELVEEQFDLCPAPGLMKSRQIYAEAKSLGMTALLDGHGGDEVISHGYERQAEMAARGDYLALWKEMRGAARIYGMPVLENYLAYLFRYAPLKKRGLLRRAIGWFGRKITRGRQAEVPPASLLTEAFRAAQEVEARMAPTAEEKAAAEQGPSERRKHLSNIASPVMIRAFEVLRRSAAAQGVEPLYPFFDKALIETCLSVPPDGKLRDGWSRRVLRDAMDGLLPRDIQWRPDKADFSSEITAFVVAYFDDSAREQAVLKELEGIIDFNPFGAILVALRTAPAADVAPVTLVMWRCLYLAHWRARIEDWNALQKDGKLW